MTTLMVIVWIIVAVGLLLVSAWRPERTHHSWHELHRRGDKAIVRREHLLGDILGLRRVTVGLLLVTLVLIGMALWQTLGVAVSLGVWLVSGAISRWRPFHRQAMRLYNNLEPRLLHIVESAPLLGSVFRTDTYVPHDQKLESVEQLLQLVDAADHVLSTDQQDIIRRGVAWHETTVDAIMTPAKDIFSIKHMELLGPLTLDDLHRSGHTRFPVIRGTIDTVLGVLDITSLLEVSTVRRSETAEKAMVPTIPKIESDEQLPTALALLQKSRQHMLLVVDSDGKTAGLVTLTDLTASLLGKNRGGVVQ